MTEAAQIPPALVQRQALDHAAARVIWLIAREGPEPDLDAALAPLSALAVPGVQEVCARFGLSGLQRDLFLLAAGPELSLEAAAALAIHPLAVDGRATPSMAEAVLGPEAIDRLGPVAHLRDAGLVDLAPGPVLAHRPLSIDAAVVHALRGTPQPSEALMPALTPVAPGPENAEGATLATGLQRAREGDALVALDAGPGADAAGLAASAFALHGLRCYALDPDRLDLGEAEIARAATRDMVLLGAGLVLPASHARLAERITAPMVLTGAAPRGCRRPVAELRLRAPATADGLLLSEADRRDETATVALGLAPEGALARRRAAEGLEGLAQPITPQAGWDDLVLPEAQMAQLRLIAEYQRHEAQVLGDWGFREQSARGLGMAALFSGPSGTGKTTAAEIVARDLGAGLYRVDLSAIVSKYIGETEKNIARIFDAAEGSGAVLIFDEGEALFAKRTSDVKDSHDRHANMETAFLLQRLEAYSGCAIVTTNLKAGIDEAFLRRLRVAVEFPFPGTELRARIWRQVFPEAVPREDLDYDALARLAIAGGTIRSVALSAAFMAAAEGTPVTMALIAQAVRQEYSKIGKPLSETELRGLA
ncbi:MAG: ATP-binding protein [Rhodobacteraceae bacterium]|nr:ATP-binding protein [Paracoccaceae bacterium]